MSCGVSMERYDRGEQENLVLGSKFFLEHPKSPKTQKLKNFKIYRVGYRCKDMVQGSSFKYILKFFVLTALVMKEVSAKM